MFSMLRTTFALLLQLFTRILEQNALPGEVLVSDQFAGSPYGKKVGGKFCNSSRDP
jgi:hypothetical protein